MARRLLNEMEAFRSFPSTGVFVCAPVKSRSFPPVFFGFPFTGIPGGNVSRGGAAASRDPKQKRRAPVVPTGALLFSYLCLSCRNSNARQFSALSFRRERGFLILRAACKASARCDHRRRRTFARAVYEHPSCQLRWRSCPCPGAFF